MLKYEYWSDITRLCKWLEIPKSVYYYKPKHGKPGAKVSTHTHRRDGSVVSNEAVVEDIS
jgi:putative transposase